MGERLSGKVAVITGAGSGLGRVAALRFGREGARIVCADIDLPAAEATVADLHASGAGGIATHVDVTDEGACAAMARTAQEVFGAVDVLYANAGIEGVGTAESTTREIWQRVIDVNLTGAWLSARAVLPVMRSKGRGVILLQASVAALAGHRAGAAYAAAKGGLVALGRQMTADYARDGVRVNIICPGMVLTPLVDRIYDQRAGDAGGDAEAARARTERLYPIGRLGTADEIAALALFLASDEASFITGATTVIDGGLSAVA